MSPTRLLACNSSGTSESESIPATCNAIERSVSSSISIDKVNFQRTKVVFILGHSESLTEEQRQLVDINIHVPCANQSLELSIKYEAKFAICLQHFVSTFAGVLNENQHENEKYVKSPAVASSSRKEEEELTLSSSPAVIEYLAIKEYSKSIYQCSSILDFDSFDDLVGGDLDLETEGEEATSVFSIFQDNNWEY